MFDYRLHTKIFHSIVFIRGFDPLGLAEDVITHVNVSSQSFSKSQEQNKIPVQLCSGVSAQIVTGAAIETEPV